MSLPIIRGASAANYPYVLTISFLTGVKRFQNGSTQRWAKSPGLVKLAIPYSKLIRSQRNSVENGVSSSKGQFDGTNSVTIGTITYSNLSLDSDIFESVEKITTQYDAPLKLSQTIPQSLSPGTPGTAFPTLANGCIGMLPFSRRLLFQTVATKMEAGPKYTTAEFEGGWTNYPTTGLRGWQFDYSQISDADVSTIMAHFIANYGKLYTFPFTDEDGTTYSLANGNGQPHYAMDDLAITFNGVNDSSMTVVLECSF